jgi:hypothetical protein
MLNWNNTLAYNEESEMEEKYKEKLLEWYLKYLNMDLGAASASERSYLMLEIMLIHYGMPHLIFEKGVVAAPPEMRDVNRPLDEVEREFEKGNLIIKYQKTLKAFFSRMVNKIDKAHEQVKKGMTPISQIDPFLELNRISLPMEIIIRTPTIELKNAQEIDNKFSAQVTKDVLLKTPIHVTYKTERIIGALVFHLCRAVEGYPLGAINKCKECRKWFLNNSKREKIYCTPKCGMRVANRTRREKIKKNNPEKYLKEKKAGSKRSRKSYVKKVKKILPNANPGRRPYIHKEGE